MKEILPGIYTFSGLIIGRVYAIKDDDGFTIIDASIKGTAEKALRQLAALGYQPSDVKRILITHAHPDHIGGLPDLKRLTGADVIASVVETPYIEGRESIPRAGGRTSGVQPGTPVNRQVQDGEIIEDVLDGLQVFMTPGHSPGHISFWNESRRALFCGDVVMNMAGLTLPFAAFTPDMDEDRRSVQKIAALGPEVIGFGHGPVIMSGAAAKLNAFAAKVRKP